MAEVLPGAPEEKVLPEAQKNPVAPATPIDLTAGTEVSGVSSEGATGNPIWLILLLIILFHLFAPAAWKDKVYGTIAKYLPVEITIKWKQVPQINEGTPSASPTPTVKQTTPSASPVKL